MSYFSANPEEKEREARIKKMMGPPPGAAERAMDGMAKGSIGGPYGAIGGAIDGALNGPIYKATAGKMAEKQRYAMAAKKVDEQMTAERLAKVQGAAAPGQSMQMASLGQFVSPQPVTFSPIPALNPLSTTQMVILGIGIVAVVYYIARSK